MEQSLTELWKVKQAKILSFSKTIVSGTAKLAQYEKSLTLKSVFEKPTLRKAFEKNDNVAYAVVHVLVNRFLDSFAFTQKLNESQIEIITVDTLDHFKYDSLEDIILFFRMARTGKFGQAKKSIDSNMIFSDWFVQYMEIKAQERERLIQQQNAQSSGGGASKEQLMHTYSKIIEVRKQRKRQEYIDALVVNMDRQMLEDTITDWSKDARYVNLVKLLKEKRRVIKYKSDMKLNIIAYLREDGKGCNPSKHFKEQFIENTKLHPYVKRIPAKVVLVEDSPQVCILKGHKIVKTYDEKEMLRVDLFQEDLLKMVSK